MLGGTSGGARAPGPGRSSSEPLAWRMKRKMDGRSRQGLLEGDGGPEDVMGETAGGAGEWLVKHARHVQPGVALRSEIPLYSLEVPLEILRTRHH